MPTEMHAMSMNVAQQTLVNAVSVQMSNAKPFQLAILQTACTGPIIKAELQLGMPCTETLFKSMNGPLGGSGGLVSCWLAAHVRGV